MPFACVISCCSNKQKLVKKKEKTLPQLAKRWHFTGEVLRLFKNNKTTTDMLIVYYKNRYAKRTCICAKGLYS